MNVVGNGHGRATALTVPPPAPDPLEPEERLYRDLGDVVDGSAGTLVSPEAVAVA